MNIEIEVLLALQVAIPCCVGMVQERADKNTMTALIVAAICSGVIALEETINILGRLNNNLELAILVGCSIAAAIAGFIAGLRMKNRIVGTLIVAGSITLALIYLDIVH